MAKEFKLTKEQIKPLVTNGGGAIATDMITVEGKKVGYMYREAPTNNLDNGWRFFSGYEQQEYVDNPLNSGVYDVNTIANYDPEIIPFLDAPVGTQVERGESGALAVVEE